MTYVSIHVLLCIFSCLVMLDSIPVWIRWLQYVSLFCYSIEAPAVNEVDGLYFI